MKFTIKLTLAATLAAAATAPTFAAVPASHNFSSRVSVTGMSYELIDLQPDDGIAAAAMFLAGGSGTSIEMLQRGKFSGDSSHTNEILGSTFSSYMLPGGSGAAAAGMGGSLTLFAMGMGSRLGGKSNGMLTSFEVLSGSNGYGLNVMLSPGTEMRWTGSFELMASADKWWGSRWSQSAGAQLSIYHGDLGDSTPESQSFYVAAFANPTLGQQARKESGSFTFSHVNTGSEWASYAASVNATTMGGYNSLRAESMGVSPIPEPSTYALFAAGIGAVGFVARRRKVASE
jgi:hypothetical protein